MQHVVVLFRRSWSCCSYQNKNNDTNFRDEDWVWWQDRAASQLQVTTVYKVSRSLSVRTPLRMPLRPAALYASASVPETCVLNEGTSPFLQNSTSPSDLERNRCAHSLWRLANPPELLCVAFGARQRTAWQALVPRHHCSTCFRVGPGVCRVIMPATEKMLAS